MSSIRNSARIDFRVGGMTCANCQRHIEEKLRALDGVASVSVNWKNGAASVEYDDLIIGKPQIFAAVESLDYKALPEGKPQANGAARAVGLTLIIAAAYILLEHFGVLNLLAPSRLAEAGMSYGMLFVIGLVTSVHCVAMCGGINLSQSMSGAGEGASGGKSASVLPSALYNIGRVLSYTIIGGVIGAIGSVFSLTNTVQGVIKLAAGVFMIIMGVNMLGFFPWLRRINPHMPKVFAAGINKRKRSGAGPFAVGLLNGLMPCGPLQAMQIYALSTGSAAAGALSMMVFSLGTVPLMFGIGALSGAMGKKFTRQAITVGAALVVVLGMSMLTQGWSLAGGGTVTAPPDNVAKVAATEQPAAAGDISEAQPQENSAKETVQEIRSSLRGGRYPAITVKAGVPVKWTIDAPDGSLNGCNYRMIIPQYNIQYEFGYGDNVIEFTPDKPGKYTYTCWMGMIRSTITVTE